MSRRSSNLEFSIPGDELEHNRIQLEHNLQNTDLSLHLSSAPDDDGHDYSDVEYPRHHSAPSPIAFASFEYRSANDFDPDDHSQYQHWSHRTFENDVSVNPYAAETLSTAAHHASQLTFSAGLGARAQRRDVSLSGAEYDPDRPLNGIIAGISSPISALASQSASKDRYTASHLIGFDPLVVDDTAELDRVLQTGQAPISVPSLRSSGSSSTSSDSHPASPRPKLSEALLRVGFSPKRPRSAQSPRSLSNVSLPPAPPNKSRPLRHASTSETSKHKPVPIERFSPAQQSISYVAADPEVKIQPPTPASSLNQSKFTRTARGVTQEIEAEQVRWKGAHDLHEPAQSTVRETRAARSQKGRYPVDPVVHQIDVTAEALTPLPVRSSHYKKVHLPDVTGLTSAVGTPLRAISHFYRYDPQDDGNEARVAATLNAIQNKLVSLESENSISRRRVRELEFELEACKKEVARERTKILGHEEGVHQQQVDAGRERERNAPMSRLDKGKGRTIHRDAATGSSFRGVNENRYQEVVEEKKALENLISTLRAHLSRLTTELSDHQQLLEELRSLRESDVQALALKGQDIDHLRQEVERLAGEVEVLRGVVEEGVKERRNVRERLEGDVRDNQANASSGSEHSDHDDESRLHEQLEPSESEDESSIGSQEHSPSPSPRPLSRLADRTMRTDHPTIGSSQLTRGDSLEPFVNEDELERINAEVEERRSERSHSTSSDSHQKLETFAASTSRSVSPDTFIQHSRTNRRVDDSLRLGQESEIGRANLSLPAQISRTPSPARSHAAPTRIPPRPGAPTPGRALQNRTRSGEQRTSFQPQKSPPPEVPFPQIRGTRLERLFFAAPEHNVNTCSVCHRRRRRTHQADDGPQARDLMMDQRDVRRRHEMVNNETDDEGFAEGAEDGADANSHRIPRNQRRDGQASSSSNDRLPPQTVLARVLRELEDDFSHYKSIYIELADQYKDMDPSSNVVKRNVLADHLREVIDVLEQKGDQIASLYDLLTFSDKPLGENATAERTSQPLPSRSSSGRQTRAS